MTNLKILFFEITQKCNAHCSQCGSRCTINSEEGISSELFESVLLDVKKNIGTNVMLNITGGEPLMRKDLFDICGYAHNLGFNWGMVTNGTLITPEIIQKMKDTGMSTISISLDGMAKTHEELRHLPHSFDTILRNLQLLQKADFLEHIQVTFIANKKNIYELPALWKTLNNLKIDSMRISCIDLIGRAKENKDLILDQADFDYLFEFINRTNAKKELQCVWSCSHYFGNTETPDLLGRRFECYTGKHVASILYNGDIFVCPNVPRLPELIQGNIKTDVFSEVWKNGFQYFRNRELNETCKKCEHVKFCKGDSLHTWDFEENKPTFCYKEWKKNKTPVLKSKQEITEVIFMKTAYEDMKNYFHVGSMHPVSMYEQLMGMAGDVENGVVKVNYVYPVFMKNRARNMGYVDEQTVKEALDELEIINENLLLSDYPERDLKFLGFIHSHPMDVNFKYSDGDKQFHKQMLERFPDYTGVLINPQDKKIKAYNPEMKSVKVSKE